MIFKKLIMLGDSNTQFGWGESGWLAQIADMFQRKCDVLQRGFSGYNTDHIKVMLPAILAEFKPEQICGLVVLMGTNDSTEASSNAIQHVPLERYAENLRAILDLASVQFGIPVDKIIVISPGKIDDATWAKTCMSNYGAQSSHFDRLVTPYAQTCVDVAREKGVACLDLNKWMGEEEEEIGAQLNDGLHFSKAGGRKLFDGLKPLLEKHVDAHLSLLYPEFSDLAPGQTKIEP